jgi:cullin 3
LADLDRTLHSLCAGKFRLLLRQTSPESVEVTPEDVFAINEGFSSKLLRVKIPPSVARTAAPAARVSAGPALAASSEAEATQSKIDEDRRALIEAAIVRIMKTRQSLSHPLLIAEVTELLGSRFIPAPADIKRRIDSLIEREYVERSPADRCVEEMQPG